MKVWRLANVADWQLIIIHRITGEAENKDTWPRLRSARKMLSCYPFRGHAANWDGPFRSSTEPQSRGTAALRHSPKCASESRGPGKDLETDDLAEWKLKHFFVL